MKNEQLKLHNKKKVCCNLIMCDMYEYHPDICGMVNFDNSNQKYYELQTVETSNGFVEQLVEKSYPFTPEYIASYEQSANYKLDVDGAISNGAKRANLGDVTAYQEALAMDSAYIADLHKRLQLANQKLAEKQKENQTTKSEVNNNAQ